MMKLMDLFLEAEAKPKAKTKKKQPATKKAAPKKQPLPPTQTDPEFLSAVQQGLANPQQAPGVALPNTQSDPEYLKQVQKGLANRFHKADVPPQAPGALPSLSQLAKDADPADPDLDGLPQFDNPEPEADFGNPEFQDLPTPVSKKVAPQQPAQKPAPLDPTGKDIPSLSQLAKNATADPATDDLPQFDQEPEEFPFGHPEFQGQDDVPTASTIQTPTQKAAGAFKQGAKAVSGAAKKAGSAVMNFAKQRGTAPTPAMGKANDPTGTTAGAPSSWEEPEAPEAGAEPGATKDGDNDMPTLRSLSKQRFGKDVFKDTSNKWKVGDVVRVGTLDGFKVMRRDPNGWVLTRRSQNYKFIPHGGLFKV